MKEIILYLSKNKKETKNWFNALGRSTPFGGTKFGFIRMITQQPQSVKQNSARATDSSGRELSDLQHENTPLENSVSGDDKSVDKQYEAPKGVALNGSFSGLPSGASNDRVSQPDTGVKQNSSRQVYTEQERNDHIRTAVQHFGTTGNWNEAGYLTTDGRILDFSGKHDGAPGGYRTVDHRDIKEALGLDYGGQGYSDAMIQFMSEGNIRLMPETGGINLQAEPTDAQYAALRRYITWALRHDGVSLDFDDQNGDTVRSKWYEPDASISKNVSPAQVRTGFCPHCAA